LPQPDATPRATSAASVGDAPVATASAAASAAHPTTKDADWVSTSATGTSTASAASRVALNVPESSAPVWTDTVAVAPWDASRR